MMIRLKYILFIFTITVSSLFGQFTAMDVKGTVGEIINIPIIYNADADSNTIINFRASMFLKNPTVFYPMQCNATKKSSITDYYLKKFSDSTYSFSFRIRLTDNVVNGDTIFLLTGELLAGSSSFTQILFDDVFANEVQTDDFSFNVNSSSPSGNISYIRFPHIYEYYPNPVNIGEESNWFYYIDKDSEIKIWLCNLEWKQLLLKEFKNVEKGIHKFTFIPSNEISAGLYWVMIETNSGYITKPIVIIK